MHAESSLIWFGSHMVRKQADAQEELLIACYLCRRFFWIDPVAYAQKALVINEFAAPRWQNTFVTNTQTGVTQTVGDAVLAQRDLPTQQFWIWVGVAVLAGTAVIFNLLTLVLPCCPWP